MPIARKSSSTLRADSRLRVIFVIGVAVSCVVPVAIAWACGPNRAIQTDRIEYSPGQTVRVTGANFDPGATVDVKLDGATVATTEVSSTGNINTSFSAPRAAGTYVLRSDGVNIHGQALEGTGNSQTITVKTPARSPSGSSPGTSPQPTPGATAPAPGRTSGGRAPSGSGGRSRTVSGGEQLQRAAAQRAAGRRAAANAGVNTTEGVINAQGTTSFAGSVPRATRAAVAAQADERRPGRAAERGSGKAARPSESSAASDAWSGLASAASPALTPGAAELGTRDGGSLLPWALLALGALALVGVGVAEVQRRRKAPVG